MRLVKQRIAPVAVADALSEVIDDQAEVIRQQRREKHAAGRSLTTSF